MLTISYFFIFHESTVRSYNPTHQILDSFTAWLGEKERQSLNELQLARP